MQNIYPPPRQHLKYPLPLSKPQSRSLLEPPPLPAYISSRQHEIDNDFYDSNTSVEIIRIKDESTLIKEYDSRKSISAYQEQSS
jgi:hypothetical protein